MPTISQLSKKMIKSLPKAERIADPPPALVDLARRRSQKHTDRGIKRAAWTYYDSLRRCQLNAGDDGWYPAASGLRDIHLDDLADLDLVKVDRRENPAATSKHFRQIFIYQLTTAGLELIGSQTFNEETPMKAPYKKDEIVIYDNRAVVIRELSDTSASVKDPSKPQDRPFWVAFTELSPVPQRQDPIPPRLLEIAISFDPVDAEFLARTLLGLLNQILKTGGWFHAKGMAHDRSKEGAARRTWCELLHKHQLLERQYGTGGYNYRWSQACADLMGLPYPYPDPPKAEESQPTSTERQYPELHILAQRLNPDTKNVDGIVEEYIGVLKICHGDSAQRAWTKITNRRQKLHFAQQIEKGDFLILRDLIHGLSAEWQITPAGSQVLGWDHPAIPAEPAPDIEPITESLPDDDEPVAIPASRLAVEVKTLRQDQIGNPERLAKHDSELARHLAEQWQVLNIQYVRSGEPRSTVRFVMLQRCQPPQPEKPRHATYVQPVGPMLTYVPGPLTQALVRDGLDAVIEQADTAVLNRFRTSYQQNTAIPARTLIPAVSQGVAE